MKLGFIGAGGNMAGAIIDSVKNSSDDYSFFLSSKSTDKLEKYRSFATVCDSNRDVVTKSDYIFLCVKPQVLPSVLDEIKSVSTPDKCFISIAAGVKIDKIKAMLGFDAKVIRVMPNTPMLIGFGASGLCKKMPVSDDEFSFVLSIFGGKNVAIETEEDKMDAVTAVSGSGPAYVYRFIKDMAQSGEFLGLSFDKSIELAVQTALGACMMIKNTDMTKSSVQTLIDNVTSPNGTTYAALCSFDSDHFDDVVKNALVACAKRSEELSK